jgi:methylmalonyl-CoA mutase
MDPIGQLAREGWFTTKDKNNFILLSAVPDSSIISIDATLYQNAGTNMVQQLAYSLAHVMNILEFRLSI